MALVAGEKIRENRIFERLIGETAIFVSSVSYIFVFFWISQ